VKGEWLTDDEITTVDGKLGYFRLLSPLLYKDNRGDTWETPSNTISDLSSFPWFVRMIVPTSTLVKSPFMHDDLYERRPIDPHTRAPVEKKRADQLYRDGAIAEGLNEGKAKIFYSGLRAGGWFTWWSYRRADKRNARKNENAKT
jgi:hypothetical protein